jgi:ligand-binding SRPBCC domain-containing protein
MRFSYHTEQQLPYPVEQMFAFFADSDNLPLLMPSWQQARIDEQKLIPPPPRPNPSSPQIPAAGVGSHLTLSFRPFPYAPFRLRWQAEITEFVWDRHFCDVQLRGPFAYWKHCHYVRPFSQSGVDATLIVDDVEYEIPFGIAGKIAHRLFLRRQIERTFAYRHAQLARMLTLVVSASQPVVR